MTAVGAAECFLVYWWDDIAGLWHQLSWAHWTASMPQWTRWAHGVWTAAPKPLPGVRAGDIRFVVCVVDDDGSIANIIPHRYVIDDSGYRHDRPDRPTMTKDERDFSLRHLRDLDPSEADCRRCDEIQERVYRWSEPSAAAVRALLRTLPAAPSMNPKYGIWYFAAAGGVTLPSQGELH